ncbi:MAG: grasp-with-spasm system SPASM domain peptide maturase [Saprospiraceae bacterium]|nr:grasp-with-spasm system SPASM domain peptide maturase [Saprospiraceae bacterium]
MFINKYSNVILLSGYKKALFLDIHRSWYIHISKDVYQFTNFIIGKTKKDAILKSNDPEAKDFIEQLINMEILFESNLNPTFFPEINDNFFNPNLITNIIWEIGELNIDEIKLILKRNQNTINCHVEFIYFKKVSYKILNEFLSIIEKYFVDLESYNLSLKHLDVANSSLVKLLRRFPRLLNITIFDIGNKEENVIEEISAKKIILRRSKIDNFKFCGVVNESLFTANLYHYTEARHHNSCLNRKISIDAEGNIKNCPSMSESFGNIKDTTLAEAIEKPGFKKYWDINKDKIHVCKDCEFRYICTDCRAYVEDPDDILSKPLKCGYNPYTGEWSKWSTNPLKQKAIDFYGMREMVDDLKKSELTE